MDMETGERWAKIAVEGDDDLITSRDQLAGMRANGGNVVGGSSSSTALIVGGDEDDEMGEGGDNFDYDLMYRTYERIPEKERPELPDRNDPNFKVVMKELWEKRQGELQEAMKRMADVPSLLEEMISSLNFDNAEVLPTLEELSYLLSDIDVARDFYILRGWPRLVSLAGDTDLGADVRGLAIEDMGNAVRNNEEFFGWIDKETLAAIAINLTGDARGKEGVSIVTKGLYGLGSMIRGNDLGRKAWLEIGGGGILKSVGEKWGHEVKIMSKLVTLASDVVAEAQDPDTLEAFGGEMWCKWASSALLHTEQATIHEKLLNALTSLKPHCNWGGVDSTKLKGVLGRVRKSWKGLDEEWRKELESLADNVLK